MASAGMPEYRGSAGLAGPIEPIQPMKPMKPIEPSGRISGRLACAAQSHLHQPARGQSLTGAARLRVIGELSPTSQAQPPD